MPVIFDKVQEQIWLNTSSTEVELTNILKAYALNKFWHLYRIVTD